MATPIPKRMKRKAKAKPMPGEQPLAKKKSRLRKMALMIDHPQHGRIEVYRMSGKELDDQTFLLQGHAFEGEAILKDGVWIQLAKQGRFFKDGSFFEIDDKAVGDIIANFEATQNKHVPVDFEHASEMKGSDGAIPMLGAPAQGWVSDLEKRGNQLWGKVEWGDLAKDYIKQGKYRYISPAIRFGTKDTKTGAPTGAKLTSAGLVNIPFLDGMKPLTAKDEPAVAAYAMEVPAGEKSIVMGDRCYSMSEYMPRLKACLKMGELSTPMECKDQLDRIREHYLVAGGANNSMGTDVGSYMTSMREMVGAHMGMSWDDVFETVDEMIDEAIDEHEARYHEATEDQDMALTAKETPDEPEAVASEPVIKPEATASTNEDKNMSDKAIEVQLKDAITESATLAVQLKDATAKVTDLDTAKAKLELQLKEATAQIASICAELVTLKDEQAKRVDADLDREVDSAISAYGKTKGVSAAEKPAMLKLLKADPESFRAIYKPISAEKATLLKDITTPTGNAPAKSEVVAAVTAQSEVAGAVPEMKTLIAKYTSEDKMDLEAAVQKAFNDVTLALANQKRATL